MYLFIYVYMQQLLKDDDVSRILEGEEDFGNNITII